MPGTSPFQHESHRSSTPGHVEQTGKVHDERTCPLGPYRLAFEHLPCLECPSHIDYGAGVAQYGIRCLAAVKAPMGVETALLCPPAPTARGACCLGEMLNAERLALHGEVTKRDGRGLSFTMAPAACARGVCDPVVADSGGHP